MVDEPKTPPLVYLATREVPRRLMGSRIEPRFEAELRRLIGDVYVTVGRVTRTSRDLAKEAARALARQRGWIVSDKRFGWMTRNVDHEIANAEDDGAEVPSNSQLPVQPNAENFVTEVSSNLQQPRTPCGNEDCDRCYPLPRFIISTERIARLRHVRTIKASTFEEALRIYNEGTARPASYDDHELAVLEEGAPIVTKAKERVGRAAPTCYHDLPSANCAEDKNE